MQSFFFLLYRIHEELRIDLYSRKVLERCVSLSRLVVAWNGKGEDPLSRTGVDGTMRARKIVMSDAAFFFRGCVALPRDPDFCQTMAKYIADTIGTNMIRDSKNSSPPCLIDRKFFLSFIISNREYFKQEN